MLRASASAALASLVMLLACGRLSRHAGDDSANGGSRAGQGPPPNGARAGSVASGGARAAGGDACDCPAQDCMLGYVAVPNADGCCFHCEPVCDPPCPVLGCAPGTRPELLPGQCCPLCAGDSCEQQRARYQPIQNDLFKQHASGGCILNEDCRVYTAHNTCGAECPVAVPTAALSQLDTSLRSFAQQLCSPSCPVGLPLCDPPAPPLCLNGRCVLAR